MTASPQPRLAVQRWNIELTATLSCGGMTSWLSVAIAATAMCLLLHCRLSRTYNVYNVLSASILNLQRQPLVALNMACCRLGNLLHSGRWNLESAWHIRRHGPSRIPTDQDLPHKAFGSQVVDDSPFDRPEILPFSVYAACRILDTTPDDQVTTMSPLLQNTLKSLCTPKAV